MVAEKNGYCNQKFSVNKGVPDQNQRKKYRLPQLVLYKQSSKWFLLKTTVHSVCLVYFGVQFTLSCFSWVRLAGRSTVAVAIARSVAATTTASGPLSDHLSRTRLMAECLVLLCLIFPHPGGIYRYPRERSGGNWGSDKWLVRWLRAVTLLSRDLKPQTFWTQNLPAHSGILAWRIPRTEEPGGLQSMGLQRTLWVTPPGLI